MKKENESHKVDVDLSPFNRDAMEKAIIMAYGDKEAMLYMELMDRMGLWAQNGAFCFTQMVLHIVKMAYIHGDYFGLGDEKYNTRH